MWSQSDTPSNDRPRLGVQRNAIALAYRQGQGSLRQLAARFGTSIGSVQRCIAAHSEVSTS